MTEATRITDTKGPRRLSPFTIPAFLANLALLVFFFAYAVGFTWAFDKVFGLPQSAIERR